MSIASTYPCLYKGLSGLKKTFPAKQDKALRREEMLSEAAIAALHVHKDKRKEEHLQALFNVTRYNPFLSSMPTAFHQQLCRHMEHRFLTQVAASPAEFIQS